MNLLSLAVNSSIVLIFECHISIATQGDCGQRRTYVGELCMASSTWEMSLWRHKLIESCPPIGLHRSRFRVCFNHASSAAVPSSVQHSVDARNDLVSKRAILWAAIHPKHQQLSVFVGSAPCHVGCMLRKLSGQLFSLLLNNLHYWKSRMSEPNGLATEFPT